MTQPVGNQAKEVPSSKPSILSLIMAALLGGGIVFILSQLQFKAWIDISDPRNTMPPVIDVNPTPTLTFTPSPPIIPLARPPKTIPDGLVVSNLSSSPVRVVLLSHQPKSAPKQANPYRLPVHWDFAPNEGSQIGLLLSLPEGNLKLLPGDILLAFALDGSRQYWGPYVVAKTALPTKAAKTSAWQLKLDP